MSLLLRTHFKLARTAIKENRTRSFLTCLGIAIGIASIILILSLTGSISRLISNEVSSIGSDLIVVRPSTSKDSVTSIVEELTSANSFSKSNLAVSDVGAISEIEGVVNVAPIAVSVNTVTDDENTIASATVLGTTPSFIDIEPLTLKQGTFITDKNKENSVVIGHMLSLLLFNTSNPIGKTLVFRDHRYIVVGVLEKIDKSINFDNVDFDNALIMDIAELEKNVGAIQVQQINVRAENVDSLPTIADQIREKLTAQKSGDTNFTVSYGDSISHPASTLLGIISGMLAAVAGISLVVGGIGVMNTTFVCCTP